MNTSIESDEIPIIGSVDDFLAQQGYDLNRAFSTSINEWRPNFIAILFDKMWWDDW